MADLPTDLFDAVVAQLLPSFGTANERQAELIPSLSDKPIFSRIEWEGTPRVFTVKLVKLLSEEELITVLKRLPVGADRRTEIDALCENIKATKAQPKAQPAPNIDRVKLRDALSTAFRKEELELLCGDIQQDLNNAGVDLPVNLDVIGASSSLPLIAQNLIGYLDRRGYVDYLVAAVRRVRPNLPL